METEYPAIAKRAISENAEIYWGDETGVSNQEYYLRGFSPKSVTPVKRFEARHERISIISAITGPGSARFMIYDGAMNQQMLIGFMKRLTKDVNRKVFLILDNLRVHHGKIVQAWLEENKDRIEVFYLPPYSPELNPDEYLNNTLKRDVHSGVRPRTKKETFVTKRNRSCGGCNTTQKKSNGYSCIRNRDKSMFAIAENVPAVRCRGNNCKKV